MCVCACARAHVHSHRVLVSIGNVCVRACVRVCLLCMPDTCFELCMCVCENVHASA